MLSLKDKDHIGPISQLVLQSTPFCNLSCSYCYLTKESRSTHARMEPELAKRCVEYVYNSGLASKKIMLRWHAGEPLAAGLGFYKESWEKISQLIPKGYELIQTLQTNATLINSDWCAFFKESNMGIGVSLDGPEFLHNRNRVTREGTGSFASVMRGIERLKKFGIPFEIISVLTEESLNYPEEIFNFFEKLEPLSLGFNIEEKEGNNFRSSSEDGFFLIKYKVFLEKIFQRQKKSKLIIREIEEKKKFMFHTQKNIGSAMVRPFYILSVDWKGNFSTFCPELLGATSSSYKTFSLGNIQEITIREAIESPLFQRMYQEIYNGVRKCEKTCEYFFLCGGGAPGNKLYENGNFDSTETSYCCARVKIPVLIILEDTLQKTASA